MTIAMLDRAKLLRQAALSGRRDPNDLFGARMAVHEALESSGVDGNRVCELLLSVSPPLSKWDCDRLELVAGILEHAPDTRGEQLYGLCDMAKLMVPW